MQHEHSALGGREVFEHREQRGAHSVVERHPVGRIDIVIRGRRREIRERERRVLSRCFPPRARRLQVVETETPDDDHEPAANIVDAVEIATCEANESLLDHVLGQADVAQHPKGDVDEMAALVSCNFADTGIERGSRHGDPLIRVPLSTGPYQEDEMAAPIVTASRSRRRFRPVACRALSTHFGKDES